MSETNANTKVEKKEDAPSTGNRRNRGRDEVVRGPNEKAPITKNITSGSRRPEMESYNRKANKEDKIQMAKESPWSGEGPVVHKGGPVQPFTVERVLSDWDRMLLAKYMPGEIESPFCAGQNILPIPTGTFKKSIAFSSCVVADASIDGARVAMGQSDFTIFMFSPTVTSHQGNGVGISGQRLGGLQVMQCNSQSTSVVYQDGFNRGTRGWSCLELYGSDFGGFAQAGMIWAAEMELSLLAPLANVVGAVYEGALTMSQIPTGGLSVSNLIGLAQKTHTGGTLFNLKGAVVNHNIIFDAFNTVAAGSDSPYVDLSLETVHFLVFQTPVVSITTGTRANFSFIGSIKGNYLFWPKANDPLANRLGQKSTQADSYLNDQVSKFAEPSNISWYDPLLKVGKEMASKAIQAFAPGVVRMALPAAHNLFKAVTGGMGQMGKLALTNGPSMNRVHVTRSVESKAPYISRAGSISVLSRLLDGCQEWLTAEDNAWLSDFRGQVQDRLEWYESLPDTFPFDMERESKFREPSLGRRHAKGG